MVDLTKFKNEWLGGRVDFDHAYAYQCVDLIRQYVYEYFGLNSAAGGVPFAISYWTTTPVGMLDKFEKVAGSDARQGDIIILNATITNPDGHIGIATGNINGSSVEMIEQNGGVGSATGTGTDAIRTRYVDRSHVAGLLRPKDSSPVAPTPAPGLPFAVESIADKQIQLNLTPTHEWNLLHTSWGDFNSDPIDHAGGEVLTVRAIAHHRLGGAYYMQQASDTRGFNTVDCHDYVAPAPTPAPAPAPENYATHYTYEVLSSPLELQTKVDTHKWDLNFDSYPDVKSVEDLAKGTKFVAYARAFRNDLDHPAYFMTQDDFAKAPGEAHGVNTVDLEPYVAPAAPVESVPVTVTPPAPVTSTPAPTTPVEKTWKDSFTDMSAGVYKAIDNAVITDVEGKNAALNLFKGMELKIAGVFTFSGTSYYITKAKLAKGEWYGIPQTALKVVSYDEDKDFNLDDIKLAAELKTIKQQVITHIGFIDGILAHLKAFIAFRKNKKQGA